MSEACCSTAQDNNTSSNMEYAKFLGLVLAITVASLLTNAIWDSISWMQHFMGWFLVAFAVFKLVGYSTFRSSFQTYDLVASRVPMYATVFPFVELLVGVALLVDVFSTAAFVLIFFMMASGAISIAIFLGSGKRVSCACLGGVIDLPLSSVSLFETLVMAVMAAWMLVA